MRISDAASAYRESLRSTSSVLKTLKGSDVSKAVRAGNAYIELGLRASIDKGLRTTARKLKSFGGLVVAAGGGTAAAVASMLAPLLSAGSRAEELQSKFDAVFGDSSEEIKKWSNEYADAVGRSQNQMMEMLGSNQDLLVPMGIDEQKAQRMSKTLAALAIDLASFNNKADADVANDLSAAITGSGEVMKKYGVILNEAAVNQELLASGMNPKSATEAQKAMARYNLILRSTKSAQGDAMRTGQSFANQMKRMRAIFEDIASALGGSVMPMFANVASVVNNVAAEMRGFIEGNDELIQKVMKVIAIGGAAAGILSGIGLAIMGAGVAIVPAITAVTGIVAAVTALFGPVGIAIAAGTALASVAYMNRDAIMNWAAAIWEVAEPIRAVGRDVLGVVLDMVGGIGASLLNGDIEGAIEILWAGAKALFFQGAAAVSSVFGVIYGSAQTAFGYVTNLAGEVAGWIANAFSASVMAIQQVFGDGFAAIFQGGKSFVQGYVSYLTEGWGILFSNTKAVLGGIAGAIMGGDIMGAVNILWASIKHAFTAGYTTLQAGWAILTHSMANIWSTMAHEIGSVFRGVTTTITGLMSESLKAQQRLLEAVAQYDPTGMSSSIAGAMGNAADFATAAHEASIGQQEAADAAYHARKARAAKAYSASLESIMSRADETRAARDAAIARGKAAGDGVTMGKLRDSSANALEELSFKAGGDDFLDMIKGKIGSIFDYQEESQDGAEMALSKRTAGSFSAAGAALLGMGGTSSAEETAKNTGEMVNQAKQTNAHLKRMKTQKQPQPSFT